MCLANWGGASCWPGPRPFRPGQTGAWAGVKHGWPQQTAVAVIGGRPSIGNGACNAALSGADYARRAALAADVPMRNSGWPPHLLALGPNTRAHAWRLEAALE
ncbi:hypothetical protein BM1_07763 [Bipolaris maydis]|nr:hypothetical protein BM1_07763 [Bipolaris maydis]